MCLIAVSIRTGAFPLVIAANRDEDYERPTVAASFWSDGPRILGGRDALHGGSWLAVTRDRRFAAVTNLRGSPRDARKRSRGELVSGFVRSETPPLQYVHDVAARADEYAGFHFLAGVGDDVVQLSQTITRLSTGVHALSNAPAGERWAKVAIAEREMTRLCALLGDVDQLIAAILDFLSAARGTNRAESEVFVKGERYGTRSSTVIVMSDDAVDFAEQSFAGGGIREGGVRRFRY